MSDHSSRLDRQAVDLLLSVVETSDAVITGSALDSYHGSAASALKASGLLQPTDHQRVAVSLADHEDEPINLIWSPERRSYGYFSPLAGWVSVPSELLAAFRIGFEQLLRRLLERAGPFTSVITGRTAAKSSVGGRGSTAAGTQKARSIVDRPSPFQSVGLDALRRCCPRSAGARLAGCAQSDVGRSLVHPDIS